MTLVPNLDKARCSASLAAPECLVSAHDDACRRTSPVPRPRLLSDRPLSW